MAAATASEGRTVVVGIDMQNRLKREREKKITPQKKTSHRRSVVADYSAIRVEAKVVGGRQGRQSGI